MLRHVREDELKELLTYLKKDVGNCFYIYIDTYVYGLDNPNMKLWVDPADDGYKLVVMKYHDSFQVYSRRSDYDINDIYQLIEQYDVQMVSGPENIIKQINEKYKGIYNYSSGTIFDLAQVGRVQIEHDEVVEFATAKDVPEIAELLSQDDYYRESYTKDELIKQFTERLKTGMGRNCIIRKDGKIVAHCATFAEADGVAIGAGLLSHRDYRGKKFGIIVESSIIRHMNSIGVTYYGFIQDDVRISKFIEMGNEIIGTYAKVVKKESN